MKGILRWDGLRLEIPEALEAVVLDRGFVRLAGDGGPAAEVRFGAAGPTFDPSRDGKRLLQAAGLPGGRLEPCREPWAAEVQARVFCCERLYVLYFPQSGGVAAVLLSTPQAHADALLASIDWTPPDRWRRWKCFDLAFDTPPDTLLIKAGFHPGAFHFGFRNGRTAMFLDRLAPADVLLADTTLADWTRRFLKRRLGRDARITLQNEGSVAFRETPPLLHRLLPVLPWSQSAGRAWHDAGRNRILLFGTSGRPLPASVSARVERSLTGHAASLQN